jgi:hypothetical protein
LNEKIEVLLDHYKIEYRRENDRILFSKRIGDGTVGVRMLFEQIRNFDVNAVLKKERVLTIERKDAFSELVSS